MLVMYGISSAVLKFKELVDKEIAWKISFVVRTVPADGLAPLGAKGICKYIEDQV